MLNNLCTLLFALICWQQLSVAQVKQLSSNEIQIGLQKLHVLGSVLYFAAHPDDENTKLIAWLAQEKKYKTAYLSLTRGDGGQNLIGTEQGIDLGLIRTQELLAARALDKGEQYFTSAYDFGFSKTHEETFKFWDKETALKEAVWIIRKLQPDVIITRFPPDKRGGHGHHQASAILAHKAFLAAADPNKYPEQLQYVKPWKATRLLWNTANFGGQNNTSEEQLKINIGDYSPLLGQSYGEIAAKSRSQHKSQGFGAATSRGNAIEYFEHVAGNEAQKELFEKINTTWSRIPQTENIAKLVQKINKEYTATQPENSIADLFLLRKHIQQLDNNSIWKNQKIAEIEELILACAGYWSNATTSKSQFTEDQTFDIQLEAIARSPKVEVEVLQVDNQAFNSKLENNVTWKSTLTTKYEKTTQPYWLINPHSLGKFDIPFTSVGYPNNPDAPAVSVSLNINGNTINYKQPIHYRYVDPVHGELNQPVVITPEMTIAVNKGKIISSNLSANEINVIFANHLNQRGKRQVNIEAPEGWSVSPTSITVDFSSANSFTQRIVVQPKKADAASAELRFRYNNKYLQQIRNISYTHIPNQTWFPEASIKCQNINLNNPIKRIGYINGAGDLVAESLALIGIEVNIIDQNTIQELDLSNFDAIVIGVRYFNISEHAPKVLQHLLKYVEDGGTVLTQYNVNSRLFTAQLGPYPFSINRDRVTEEDAKVTFDSKDPAFNYPNKISNNDFDHWVQERGLYFANNIDPKYRSPIQMNDQDEPAHNGALLITKYGKGKFVYTSLSFFRQLPAGVPGAYRLFVNLLSKEK